jgi:putative ABC transport system substrate-binding protein
MRRRDVVRLLAGAAIARPFAAVAQGAKLPTIGLMGSGTAAEQAEWTAAFVQRLRELGWTEGSNVAIEYRWEKDALIALPRSLPSSSASTSM